VIFKGQLFQIVDLFLCGPGHGRQTPRHVSRQKQRQHIHFGTAAGEEIKIISLSQD